MSLNKGSLSISDIYVGNTPIAAVYKGSDLVWQKQNGTYIEFIITEYKNNGSGMNEVNYSDPDAVSITYDNNGTPDLGTWENWINDHFTPVMLKSNGTVDYALNRDNLSYKADGTTPSDVANINYDGNAMLQIKKFYIYVFTEESNDSAINKYINVRISDTKIDNNYTCWGFVDENGNEQDYAYYALFCCHKDSNNKLRSISGIDLSSNHLFNYSDAVTYAKNNGNGWDISNLALENAIGLVLMMLYKTINPLYKHNIDYLTPNPQDSNAPYLGKQNMSVARYTGSRIADGGFPSNTNTQQVKALWIENYWRSYNNGHSSTWVNGLIAIRNSNLSSNDNYDETNHYFLKYKLKAPYGVNLNVSEYNDMSDTNAFVYQSTSKQITDVAVYDNLLFAGKNYEYRAQGISSSTDNRFYFDSEALGAKYTQFDAGTLYPVKTGYCIRGKYDGNAHFLCYQCWGKQTGGNNFQTGSGRLTYLPQSSSNQGA